MSATAERMTVDDYYAITVEGDRKELVGGAIVVNDGPTLTHVELQGRIFLALTDWIRTEQGRGLATFPQDVRLGEHDLYGPDLTWLADPDPARNERDKLAGVPDICVEVRSPSPWRHDLGAKRRGYERGGLPELWLVDDEERRVIVLRRSRPDAPRFDVELELRGGDVLTSPQLPGFELPLADLFRP